MNASPGRTALYRYFDARDRLLYVGISSNPDVRWGQHKGDKPWAPLVVMRIIEWLDSREAALAAESIAIRVERPIHNHTGTPKMFTRTFDPAPMAQRYCGAAEIAKAFGVARQRVQQLITRPGFPTPAADLAMGKVWESADVHRWGIATGRLKEETETA